MLTILPVTSARVARCSCVESDCVLVAKLSYCNYPRSFIFFSTRVKSPRNVIPVFPKYKYRYLFFSENCISSNRYEVITLAWCSNVYCVYSVKRVHIFDRCNCNYRNEYKYRLGGINLNLPIIGYQKNMETR